MMIAALAGGVGGTKLLYGLYHHLRGARELTVVGNTGDDIELYGLRICPDLDTVTYTLTGLVNPETGWGLKDETFRCLGELSELGAPHWFKLGDRDLATHIFRSRRLREGASLSQVTAELARARGLRCRLIPMTDSYVPTYIETDSGPIHFQDYFVRLGTAPEVRGLRFGASKATQAAPGLLDCLEEAEMILVCPSNPLISIGPILAVPGVRETLRRRRSDVWAVSPVVGGKSLKGPTSKMMSQLGHEVSALGVARLYADFVGTIVIDSSDQDLHGDIEGLGLRTYWTDTVMTTPDDKLRLAEFILGSL